MWSVQFDPRIDWRAFVVTYCGPIVFMFGLTIILFLALPKGWTCACDKDYAVELGPTYSSVFLALPALAKPHYGNLTTRVFGFLTAVASFVYWGTLCNVAHGLDVILVTFFPLFIWEALAVKRPLFKYVFALCALGALIGLSVYSYDKSYGTPFSSDDGLWVTVPVALGLLTANIIYVRWQRKAWRWKKELAAATLAGVAGGLLSFRRQSTITWGHVCAGLALYVASVDTDVYMKASAVVYTPMDNQIDL